MVEVTPAVRVTVESLRQYGVEAFVQAGLPEEGARLVTEVQLEASLRGQATHNVGGIPGYATRVAKGLINPRPEIRVERESAVHAQIDGDNGPGQWVSVVAMRQAVAKARTSGVGMVTAGHSNHFGAAGHYAWLAATEGVIGICTTNCGPSLAPWGGVTPTLGNNPLGAGVPAGSYPPIVLDIAMSTVAMGKIALAIAEGKTLPPGWILNRRGEPSTDAADFRESRLGVPIAGHKGYGLTMIMEVLAGVLTGADFPWQHRDDRRSQAEYEPNLGHFFLAIDPRQFMPFEAFTARVDAMIEAAKASELAAGVEEILVPGELEMRARERHLREGVPLLPSTYRTLLEYGEKVGLQTELVSLP
ncbi:MAG TPA: Ldh family oxidoreductase [Chloroflexota bacterium]|jgi:LDH2 family malate/lactate/ureidoglycolate dehydrogenase|nr:Ldh family oxidoreductase [Chloroflexota bacterium]